jgi:hypothetical protein
MEINNKVLNKLTRKDFLFGCIISAYNPNNKQCSASINESNHNKLILHLKKRGFRYVEIDGFYNRSEKSVLVIYASEIEGQGISNMFKQECFIYVYESDNFKQYKLIFPNDTVKNTRCDSITIDNDLINNYSIINGTKFSIDFYKE